MRRVFFISVLLSGAFLFFNNTNLFMEKPAGKATLLAHRGVAQEFDERGLQNDTCTATRIFPPKHAFLENTIASTQASFNMGADIVELDVQPTTDGHFAVFHDWTLDCRTNGKGVTRTHTLAELKALDIGYGYTADGGKTFPFRGKYVAKMPELGEMLSAFPNSRFVINVKSKDPREGKMLAGFLSQLIPERRAQLIVSGDGSALSPLKKTLPDMRLLEKQTLMTCIPSYMIVGWSGFVPTSCHQTVLLVPINVAPWLWGWPYRFLERMNKIGTEVFLTGPYHGGAFSTGIDTPEEFNRVPKPYPGGIWTNNIETITGLVHSPK